MNPAGLQAEFLVHRTGQDPGFSLELGLDVEPGTTTAMLGPNGAGKSTAVAVVAGGLAIDRGVVRLGSTVLDQPDAGIFVPPEHRSIGVVFQDYLLFEHLSVVDNVAFGPLVGGAGRSAARATALRWLDRLGLDGLEQRRPSALSGGQAQRVALARALATEPELLLLDEPLAALDVSTRAGLRRMLTEHLASYDGPRLLITHEPADAFAMADRVCILEHGRVSQQGTVDEIRRRPATPYVAALAGTNFLTGVGRHGTVTVDDSGFALQTAGTGDGPVQAVIPPRAVSLHRRRPDGSPRNTWASTIDWIEPLGDTTRIRLGPPLPLMVDITPAAAEALALAPGGEIWAAVKATEVAVTPIEPADT